MGKKLARIAMREKVAALTEWRPVQPEFGLYHPTYHHPAATSFGDRQRRKWQRHAENFSNRPINIVTMDYASIDESDIAHLLNQGWTQNEDGSWSNRAGTSLLIIDES